MYTHKPQLLDVRPSDWRTPTQPQTDGCTPTYQTVGSTSKKPSILSDWQLHTYNIQHIRLMAAQPQISDWQIYNHKAQYIRLSDVHPQRPTYQTFGHTAKISEWRTYTHKAQHIRLMEVHSHIKLLDVHSQSLSDWWRHSHKDQHIRLTDVHRQKPSISDWQVHGNGLESVEYDELIMQCWIKS